MRFVTQGEIAILSVERIREYCSLPKEAPAVTDLRPPESWPAIGQIAVRNLSVQYAPELPMVLKKLSFNCHAGEKVAVVGSTGSGKSTLSLALFRLIEPAEGSIVIDNIDVSKIGLQDLRSRMTIVTQDPVRICIVECQSRPPDDSMGVTFTDNPFRHSPRSLGSP